MRISEFLMDIGRPVAFYPKLVDITGSVTSTLFLCQMLYWVGKQRDHDGWIFKTQAEIREETGLTRREQEGARKKLKDLGFLEEKYAQIPKVLHYRIMTDVVNNAWEELQKAMHQTAILYCQPEDRESSMHRTANKQCTEPPHSNAQNSQSITEITQKTTHRIPMTSPLAQSTIEEDEPDSIPDTRKEPKAFDRPSKFTVVKGSQDLNKVVADAKAKSVSARQAKNVKPIRKNSTAMLGLFTEMFRDTFNGAPPVLDSGKDRKLLKDMIDHYGYDTVADMMNWMFKDWGVFVRDCKLKGLPSIGLLFGFRSYLQEKIQHKLATAEGDMSDW